MSSSHQTTGSIDYVVCCVRAWAAVRRRIWRRVLSLHLSGTSTFNGISWHQLDLAPLFSRKVSCFYIRLPKNVHMISCTTRQVLSPGSRWCPQTRTLEEASPTTIDVELRSPHRSHNHHRNPCTLFACHPALIGAHAPVIDMQLLYRNVWFRVYASVVKLGYSQSSILALNLNCIMMYRTVNISAYRFMIAIIIFVLCYTFYTYP